MTDPKLAMRAEAYRRRKACDPAWGAALAEHVLARCPPGPGEVVAGFWPMDQEIDIRPLLIELSSRGPLVLPVTPRRGHPLSFRLWSPGERMEPEPFGTWRPVGAEMTPDYLLVPLLAWDDKGGRLGYGLGFYDRTLAALPNRRLIGCAYAAQQVDCVPMEAHDIRMDAIATERGVTFCKDA